jgi:glutaminyl-tRNA synthetase
MNEIAAARLDPSRVNADELAKVIAERDRIPRELWNQAVATSASGSFVATEFLRETTIADASELDPVLDRILAEHAGQVDAYRAGKQGLLGFFIGQVMKETNGRANPKVVNERLREKLSA